MSELEYVDCPFCHASRCGKAFISKDYLYSQKEFTVVRCESCRLLFTNPRVRESQISSYYFSDYSAYRETKRTANYFTKTKNRLGYIFGNYLWQILRILKSRNARAVLEIGPGGGDLLYFLKEHGFEVVGVEIDSKCVERIKKKDIACYLGDLDEVMAEINLERYDAVILHHVFEHLYNPIKALKNIHKLLSENGIVYLSMPNSASIEAKLFGKYWRGFDLPRHIIHYDVNSIKTILQAAEFKIIKLGNELFPSSFIESIGFLLFKGRMPPTVYYFLYYPWKILGRVHSTIIGSGVMRIVARKA